MTVAPPVPADATGRYPNLVGYAPVATSRRVVIVLADAAIGTLAYGLATGVALAANGGALGTNGSALGVGVPTAILALVSLAQLWALFARSARLAGVLLGAQFVGVVTGRRSPGRLLLSFLLQGFLGGLTLGIAPLILYFASVRAPFNRNWFDRVTGLMLVDVRKGRRPGDPPPAPAVAVPLPPVAAVQFPGAVDAAVQASPAGSGPAFGPLSAAAPDEPTAGAPGRTSPAPEPGRPVVSPVVQASGIITSTPLGSAAPTPARREPEASFAPPVVVREMRSVDAAQADRTQLVPDPALVAATRVARALLDDGTPIPLTPPSVLGRNPRPPGSHPDATPLVLDDQLASKTHLLLGSDEQGPWVIDLHSTNGVLVRRAAADVPGRIQPGRKVRLAPGATVHVGARTIEVR